MEPQLPRPQLGPEVSPNIRPAVQGGEAFSIPGKTEVQAPVEQGRETRESLTDGPKGDPGAVQAVFTPPPLPVIDPAQTAQAVADTGATNPATAADEDLIEREWVEKAKKIVAENRDDPHAQDLAVGQLQADYLKKRYGKVVALPKEE